MIRADNIVKKFGDFTALKGVSFEINGGEICGYIGVNGAGKSTTIKILAGILAFDSGQAFIKNIDVQTNQTELKKIIGYVPESQNLFNSLKVKEHFEFVKNIYELESVVYKKRLDYFTDVFEFGNYFNDSIGVLSKGNKQKVLITSALLHNPDVIFLDEPLNGLDANSIFVLIEILKSLSDKGKAIFFCSHLLHMIEKIATRIIIIDNGTININENADVLKQSQEFVSLEQLFRDIKNEDKPFVFPYEEIFS
jgi:ABC-2 type transport system ATP-binding protein